MIKINGKNGDLDIAGGVNEITTEIAMVIYYLAEAYQQNKSMSLEDSIAYIANQVEEKTQELRGQNVIPLRQMSLEKSFEFSLAKASDNVSFLYGDAADKLAAYEDTGLTPTEIKTLQDNNGKFQELVKRNIAKKVDENSCCPICNTYAKDDEGIEGEFCPNCGQRLDWSDENA